MAINLLIPIGVALGGYGVYRWWKGHHGSVAPAYVAPTPGIVPPARGGSSPAAPSTVDPGFVPGPDPLAPPGGYAPGGYNPYIPDQPTYQPPDLPSAPIDYQPPNPQADNGGGGSALDPANWNPLDPMFWDSGSSVSGVHTRDAYGVGGNDRSFRALQARRLRRRGGL